MEEKVYASLKIFAKKLDILNRQSRGSYLPSQTPAGENYHAIIKRAVKETREAEGRQ